MAKKPVWRSTLIRVAIVVEGDTEREFIEQILVGHLHQKGVDMKVINLGGGVSVSRIAKHMRPLCKSFQVITSLVDYFGFKKRGNKTVKELEQWIREEVTKKMPRRSNCEIHPYVQQYEFEGLLFSDVEAFEHVPGISKQDLKKLKNIRKRSSPENINDKNPPSKRIERVFPQYDKVVNGVDLATRIKLTKIRKECKRFNCWVTFLESLGDNT